MILSKTAFTLIEIVVSLAILALGILAIFSLIPVGVQQTKKGHDQSKAIILAQSKMEEIIAIAGEDWENFNSYNHYQFSTPEGKNPKFMGPNKTEEKQIWGWENVTDINEDSVTWVQKIGYQWEWHFVSPETPMPSSGTLALITLTVSWPQEWSEVDSHEGEKAAITNIQTQKHVTDKNIQFVRLISYVSKGL
jgi:prepilin-type N-terminal cleavage/methylation domain-containing protein